MSNIDRNASPWIPAAVSLLSIALPAQSADIEDKIAAIRSTLTRSEATLSSVDRLRDSTVSLADASFKDVEKIRTEFRVFQATSTLSELEKEFRAKASALNCNESQIEFTFKRGIIKQMMIEALKQSGFNRLSLNCSTTPVVFTEDQLAVSEFLSVIDRIPHDSPAGEVIRNFDLASNIRRAGQRQQQSPAADSQKLFDRRLEITKNLQTSLSTFGTPEQQSRAKELGFTGEGEHPSMKIHAVISDILDWPATCNDSISDLGNTTATAVVFCMLSEVLTPAPCLGMAAALTVDVAQMGVQCVGEALSQQAKGRESDSPKAATDKSNVDIGGSKYGKAPSKSTGSGELNEPKESKDKKDLNGPKESRGPKEPKDRGCGDGENCIGVPG
jgi:hypothetical protein